MALKSSDFDLTDRQLERINRYFADQVTKYAQAGEDPPGSVKVVFEWVPGLDRFVTAYFDSAVNGHEIEIASEEVV